MYDDDTFLAYFVLFFDVVILSQLYTGIAIEGKFEKTIY